MFTNPRMLREFERKIAVDTRQFIYKEETDILHLEQGLDKIIKLCNIAVDSGKEYVKNQRICCLIVFAGHLSLWDLHENLADNKNARNALGKLIYCFQRIDLHACIHVKIDQATARGHLTKTIVVKAGHSGKYQASKERNVTQALYKRDKTIDVRSTYEKRLFHKTDHRNLEKHQPCVYSKESTWEIVLSVSEILDNMGLHRVENTSHSDTAVSLHIILSAI
ncbi:hypothetical protein GQX74_009657 [Glossina fuscipes]|nr:hypothetical protein GQX74_009657 [Glossina fuscipes]